MKIKVVALSTAISLSGCGLLPINQERLVDLEASPACQAELNNKGALYNLLGYKNETILYCLHNEAISQLSRVERKSCYNLFKPVSRENLDLGLECAQRVKAEVELKEKRDKELADKEQKAKELKAEIKRKYDASPEGKAKIATERRAEDKITKQAHAKVKSTLGYPDSFREIYTRVNRRKRSETMYSVIVQYQATGHRGASLVTVEQQAIMVCADFGATEVSAKDACHIY